MAEWPYTLPIWRSSHSATSPDGEHVATIDQAYEISMGNPTSGTLRLGDVLTVEDCSPSFVWSDDSRYLAVAQFYTRLLLFRRQRILVIDVEERRVLATPGGPPYYQPETFRDDELVAVHDPHDEAERMTWRVPQDLDLLPGLWPKS